MASRAAVQCVGLPSGLLRRGDVPDLHLTEQARHACGAHALAALSARLDPRWLVVVGTIGTAAVPHAWLERAIAGVPVVYDPLFNGATSVKEYRDGLRAVEFGRYVARAAVLEVGRHDPGPAPAAAGLRPVGSAPRWRRGGGRGRGRY